MQRRSRLTFSVAAQKADPGGLAVEDHEQRQIGDGRGQGCAGTDEGADSHSMEGTVGLSFVRVQFWKREWSECECVRSTHKESAYGGEGK